MALLMLAIPLQGVAATTMLVCGPNHHNRNSGSLPHSHAEASEHVINYGEMRDARRADDIDAENLASAVIDDTTTDGKCSVCASCCSGAVIAARFESVQFREFADEVFLPHITFFIDAPLRGLKRPPRA
jgi:hypothetical protein